MRKLFAKMMKHYRLMKFSKEFRMLVLKERSFSIISTLVSSILVLFLQYSNESMKNGEVKLAMFFFIIYLSRNLIMDLIKMISEVLQEQLEEKALQEVNKNAINMLSKVADKLKKKDGSQYSLIEASKNIENYWNIYEGLIATVVSMLGKCISILILGCGVSRITNTKISIEIVCGIIVVVFLEILITKNALKKDKIISEKEKENLDKQAVRKNDIFNIPTISCEHFNFMGNKYIELVSQELKIRGEKRRNFFAKLRKQSLLEFGMLGFAILVKYSETPNIDSMFLIEILATMKILEQLLYILNSNIDMYQRFQQEINSLNIYIEDVDVIYRVYEDEKQIQYRQKPITSIEINPFEFSYDGEKSYTLISKEGIKVVANEIVLLKGSTGSGKSTFMEIIANKFDSNVDVQYLPKASGKARSLEYTPKYCLGSQTVLKELVWGDVKDEERLIEILKGLNLYQEISQKADDVLDYLEKTKANQFSTGQQQRLALARLLYHLDESIQIVILDEATNALNDEIADKVLHFAIDFIKRDRERIILIASHQTNVASLYADRIYSIENVGNATYEIVPN